MNGNTPLDAHTTTVGRALCARHELPTLMHDLPVP
jgi:hypothetical protein